MDEGRTVELLFSAAVVAVLLAFVVWMIVRMGGRTPLEKKYAQISSGGALFDQAFHPTGYQAREDWESQKIVPVPAPSPDKGPGVVDFEHGTIEIEVEENDLR